MAESQEARGAGKPRRPRKTEVPDSEKKDPGPIVGRSIQVNKELFKDVQKKAIDLDISGSALVVRWMRSGMRRYGVVYKGEDDTDEPLVDSTDEARDSVEVIPMGEPVTSSEDSGASPPPGAGEGTDDGTTPRLRKRA